LAAAGRPTTSAPTNAGGIDQLVLDVVAFKRHRNTVTRGAGHVAGDQAVFIEQSIDQSRLTGIWAADDRYSNAVLIE